MLKFMNCTVKDADGLGPDIKNAQITTLGNSPNSTVMVSVERDGKMVRVNRLFDTTIKGRGTHWQFVGRSEQLEAEVGLGREESVVTLNVVVKGGCQNCG